MHSPDHPTKDPTEAKIGRSAGFEAMAIVTEPPVGDDLEPTGDPRELVGFACYLEKPVRGAGLPFFGFSPLGDPGFEQDAMPYPISPAARAIGEAQAIALEPRDPRLFSHLILERDDRDGIEAAHKWIVRHDVWLDGVPGGGPFDDASQSMLADLLNLADPHDLDGDGNETFRFPFLTPETVLPVDEQTVLVVNDNNYPFTSGRTPGQPDPTEFILIRFDKPLFERGAE